MGRGILAKNEVSVPYDKTAVYYDELEKVWKVHFYTADAIGGDQCVYLNENGTTVKIVFGE